VSILGRRPSHTESKKMIEERQVLTLGVHFMEVSISYRVKEND